ncbi:MAG: sulfatase-like hydrolase/transferase [Beijerinckiaceae bacterium]
MPQHRNVLFIVADQLRADVLDPASRSPLAGAAPAPNLAKLAQRSTLFAHHFTVTAPCGPARASLLTGLYAMNHGVIYNGSPLSSRHTNIALQAARLGYEPLLFGYTDTAPDPADHAPDDPALSSAEGILPGFREMVEMRFMEAAQWPAHLRGLGYDCPAPGPDFYQEVSRPQGGKLGAPALYTAEHSDTAFLTDETLKSLSARQGAPWFAHVTYLRPHPPLVAPAPWNRLVDPASLPPPCAEAPDHAFVDAWFSKPSEHGLFWGYDGNARALSTADIALCRATYLAMIAELDHHIGRLLDFLDASGQAENTLVVFTADHGEMLGDNGMWGKLSVFDGAFHVPLIVCDPGNPQPRRIEAITESVDVTPTILDWLGAAPPTGMDGRSLTQFVSGQAPENWRTSAFLEIEFGNPSGAPSRFQHAFGNQSGPAAASATRAAILRERDWKYVYFAGGVAPMLFDLAADPHETRNLAADPAHAARLLQMARRMPGRRMENASSPFA